jgi:hypothetical protein
MILVTNGIDDDLDGGTFNTMMYCLSTVNKQAKEKGSYFLLILTHVILLLVSKVALHAHCLECNGEGTMLFVSASVTWECITDDLLNVASILFYSC